MAITCNGAQSTSSSLERHLNRIHTGLPWVDRFAPIHLGEMLCITAGTAAEKTAITRRMAWEMTEAGYDVCLISTQANTQTVRDRLSWITGALYSIEPNVSLLPLEYVEGNDELSEEHRRSLCCVEATEAEFAGDLMVASCSSLDALKVKLSEFEARRAGGRAGVLVIDSLTRVRQHNSSLSRPNTVSEQADVFSLVRELTSNKHDGDGLGVVAAMDKLPPGIFGSSYAPDLTLHLAREKGSQDHGCYIAVPTPKGILKPFRIHVNHGTRMVNYPDLMSLISEPDGPQEDVDEAEYPGLRWNEGY